MGRKAKESKACTRCGKAWSVKRYSVMERVNASGEVKQYLHTICHKCKAEDQKLWARERRKDPEFRAAHNESARIGRILYYGIDEQDYNEILALQGGGCALCGRAPKEGRRLDIDHKHQPNDKKRLPIERAVYVRGLLCHLCNRALGLLHDNIEAARKMVNYLECPPAVSVVKRKVDRAIAYLKAHEEKKRKPK